MELIYIVIVVLIIVAAISIVIRRVKHRDQKPTIETRILSNIYGSAAFPDLEGNIEESIASQNRLAEVIDAVHEIFHDICGDKAACIDEQEDPAAGSFSLTYQIQDLPEPLVFECRHLGTFHVYFRYGDRSLTEEKRDALDGRYDHWMEKDNIRSAVRMILEEKYGSRS